LGGNSEPVRRWVTEQVDAVAGAHEQEAGAAAGARHRARVQLGQLLVHAFVAQGEGAVDVVDDEEVELAGAGVETTRAR
jgi:hypothetical protein